MWGCWEANRRDARSKREAGDQVEGRHHREKGAQDTGVIVSCPDSISADCGVQEGQRAALFPKLPHEKNLLALYTTTLPSSLLKERPKRVLKFCSQPSISSPSSLDLT